MASVTGVVPVGEPGKHEVQWMTFSVLSFRQSFDAVGWETGRAPGLHEHATISHKVSLLGYFAFSALTLLVLHQQ